MRLSHILLAVLAALSAGGCMQRQAQPTAYVMDPQTGQTVPVVAQQRQFTQPQYAQPVYQQPVYHAAIGQSLFAIGGGGAASLFAAAL